MSLTGTPLVHANSTSDYRGLAWKELLSRSLSEPRDEEAWRELHRRIRTFARIASRSFNFADPDAVDEVSAAVIFRLHESPKLVRRLVAPHDPRDPQRYVIAMVRNAVVDYARRQLTQAHAFRHQSAPDVAASGPSPQDVLLDRESADQVRELLWSELSQPQLELLQMRFWEGRSISEIAASLGVRYHTAAVRLNRLLRKLRLLLQDPTRD